jgi:hypothetical protein
VNTELEGHGTKCSWPDLRQSEYTSICLMRLRRVTKISLRTAHHQAEICSRILSRRAIHSLKISCIIDAEELQLPYVTFRGLDGIQTCIKLQAEVRSYGV